MGGPVQNVSDPRNVPPSIIYIYVCNCLHTHHMQASLLSVAGEITGGASARKSYVRCLLSAHKMMCLGEETVFVLFCFLIHELSQKVLASRRNMSL